MNANELRIENYITHNGRINQIGGYIAFYNQYPHPMINLINNSGQYGIHTIEAIQITEKWLLNFGFIYQKECDIYYLNYLEIEGYKQNVMIANYNGAEIKLQYVHQLQNLYFALTGEELVFSSTEP